MIDTKKLKENNLKHIQQSIDDWVVEAICNYKLDGVVEPDTVKKLILFGCYTMTHEVIDGLSEPACCCSPQPQLDDEAPMHRFRAIILSLPHSQWRTLSHDQ